MRRFHASLFAYACICSWDCTKEKAFKVEAGTSLRLVGHHDSLGHAVEPLTLDKDVWVAIASAIC